MVFTDRRDAGRALAQALVKYKDDDLIVLALPRGGVPIGFEIAQELSAPLDVLVVRKLGAPLNPELGIGAIAPDGIRVLDYRATHYLGIAQHQIDDVERKERAELERRIKTYRGKDPVANITNKTVILVDDGLATGVTMRAAVKAVLRQRPHKLIIAIPVCAHDSAEGLKSVIRVGVDDITCLMTPYDFMAVGVWYSQFDQVSDDEVIRLLNQSKNTE